MFNQLINKKYYKVLALTLASTGCISITHAADEQFNDALQASNSGNLSLLQQYRSSMENDVLGYYPEYWSLNNNLANQPASNIVNFAQRYPQSAMSEKLAADYVEEKVKQADFAPAQPVLAYVSNPDPAESCAIAQVRAKSGDPLVFAEYKDVWLTTSSQPESCTGLGRMMLSSPLMTEQDRQQRLWGQLRAGQSGQALATAQSLGMSLSLAQLNQIQANPLNYLWSAPKSSTVEQAYLVFAMGRLADSDLNTALSSVQRAAQGAPEPVQKALYRAVGYIGGTTVMKNNFNREVLNYLDASYGLPFSGEEAEIYARQAIRFNAWESLIRAIDAMSVSQKQEDRWQYWLARASEQRGDASSKRTAESIFKKLAQGDEYHNLLAKDKLGQGYSTVPNNVQPSNSDVQRLSQDIHFSRAFALRRVNAPDNYINREWNWAVRQAYLKHDDGLLLAAAKRATDMGWYDRAIYAADRTENKHNYAYRYAMPHQNYVVSHSRNAGIDPAWAYGLMRQESRFVSNARSHVGAGGLMQIMPDTAKLVARQMGETYNPAALTDMNTNIRYGTLRTYGLADGRGPALGQVFRNPDLARTYRAIAAGGRDAFYQGDVARTVDRYFKRIGGWLRYEDLAAHRSEWIEPSQTDYRGTTVHALGANTQGLATLQMLNILERFDLKGAGFQSALSIHLQAEAKRLAYEDRARYYADPNFAKQPVEWLISKQYAAERAKLIRPDRILTPVYPGQAPSRGDTTYFSCADKDGMMVSMIQSNFRGMGSGLVADGLGFMFQDRGQLFSLKDGHPNIYAPGKRPFQTIIPGFATRGSDPWMSFGVMGGDMQPQGQTQIIVNRVDYGLEIQSAGDSPRWHHEGSSQSMGEDSPGMGPTGLLRLETGVPLATRQRLAEIGWTIGDPDGGFGRYESVEHRMDGSTRVYAAASEMRADGCALAY